MSSIKVSHPRLPVFLVFTSTGEVTQSQMVIFDDALHVPPPVLLPEVAAQQQLRWVGEKGVGDMNGDSDSQCQR
jgi:hypothetical protein